MRVKDVLTYSSSLHHMKCVDESKALAQRLKLDMNKKVELHFLYTGDIRELLKELAEKEINDISITEPSLEEIFMNYYKTNS